ncbi:ATP-dependent helicase [Escherichia coli]|uniref:UvrD-helicase domain-containing protein n=1 Tax=Edwardsiella tarda TaxID=636 RepID=UPI00351C3EF9|nr:ATP-dependent helicase [Escherichia coli]
MKSLPLDTPEQALITNYTGSRLVVRAYAGTGKTTTLVKYALKNQNSRILYIAYNRAIRDEAKEKFPANVDCKTSHQLAYAVIGRLYHHKLTGNIRLSDIAQAVNTKNWTAVQDIRETLNTFMSSADKRILYSHFIRSNTGKILTSKQERYQIWIVESAEAIWNRMTNPQDPFPTVHDCYLKQYQLSMPNLSTRYTTILFDEAQDANPVTSNIVLQQNCKVILVGDRHQQIYRFRGANNALDSEQLKNADQLHLTHSFRFGPNVSLVANALLELKKEDKPLVGKGPQDKVVMSLPNNIGHKAILHRTVMGVIETALMQTENGAKVFWVGGIDAYQINEIQDLFWFSRDEKERIKNKKILEEYEDYLEYQDIAEATKDSEMLRAIKIINNYDDIPSRLSMLRRNTVKEEFSADISVSTAHRCKGLEWDFVQLYDDFPDVLDPKLTPQDRDDEINLLYVASTRAMRMLAINSALESVVRYITQKRLLKKQKETVESSNNPK